MLGTLGSFDGNTSPNVNMLEIFTTNELTNNPNSFLRYGAMVIKKIGIYVPPNTVVTINDSAITIVTGIFELGYGQVDVYNLVFESTVAAHIYYLY